MTERTYRFGDSSRPGLLLGLAVRHVVPLIGGVLGMYLIWFPFNREVTLQTSDVTDKPVTWTKFQEWGKFLNGWMETGATSFMGRSGATATPGSRRAAATSGPENDSTLTVASLGPAPGGPTGPPRRTGPVGRTSRTM